MQTAEQTSTIAGQPAMLQRQPVATKTVAACAYSTIAGGQFLFEYFTARAAQALRALRAHGWLLALGLLACLQVGAEGVGASPGSTGDTWREEVLLHDGKTLIVTRSQSYGGRHEIGQSVPAKEHTIRFSLPNTTGDLIWTSEYGEDLGRTNFNLLALHVKQGTPYLIVEPNLCLSYNKWGRPNPPYLVFMWGTTGWTRLSVGELPPELNTINLIINNSRIEEIQQHSQATGYVPAEYVKVINDRLPHPEYRSILREPINYDPSCIPMITNEKGLWLSRGWFSKKPSLEACLAACKSENFSDDTCPCKQFFKAH